MEWLSKSEIEAVKSKKREDYFKGISLRRVSMLDCEKTIHSVATKVYFELSKIKTRNQISHWVKNLCGLSTTYVKDMTLREKVLFINIYLTVPPCRGSEK